MIFVSSFFICLLMLITVSWFLIPFCIFGSELYRDLTRTIRWGKPFPFGATFGSFSGVLIAGCFSAFATLGLYSDLYGIWHPEKCPREPQRTRDVFIQVPEKVRVHTEFRLDDTVIGKEVL